MTEGVPKLNLNTELHLREVFFYRNLDLLPLEIACRWRDEFEELAEPTVEFFDRFDSFRAQRYRALDSSTEIDPGTSEEIILEIEGVKKVIRETFGDPHHFLGNGFTAEVYELPIAPNLCVKYIYDQEAYNQNNHIRVEHDFLAELREFTVEGVRTPVPYFVRIHPSEGHSYGMERIRGKSLSQVLEKPAENIEYVRLAKQLDRKTVERKLIAFIQATHQNFKITHGDLFMRNLMLDQEGNFFVIDFGKAKREEIGEDHEARRKVDIATITSEIGLFFRGIDNLVIN